jgi:hypothetical protein
LAGQVASVELREDLVGAPVALVAQAVSGVAQVALVAQVGLGERVASVAQVEPAVLALAVLAPGVRLDRQVNCLAPLEEMEYPALQFLQTAAYHNFNSSLLRPAARMPAVGSLAESDKELDLVEV